MRDVSLKLMILLVVLANVCTAAQRFSILQYDATWRYNTNCLDSTGWEQQSYSDSNWDFGVGGFTGGETSTGILAVCATRTLPPPSSQGGRAMYFRVHFDLSGVSISDLSLIFSNAVDDAAVYYLNGVRVRDLRVAANPALCANFGGAAIGPNTDASLWEVFALTPSELAGILQPNDNVLAVSVHQNNSGSSDMVFACSVTGEIAFPPRIIYPTHSTNVFALQCRNLTLTIQAEGSPAPSYQWYHYGSPIDPGANNTANTPSLTISNATSNDAGSYFCEVGNYLGTTNSPIFQVYVTQDAAPPIPLRAVVSAVRDLVTIVFDEPLLPGTGGAEDAFLYQIRDVPNMGGSLLIQNASLFYASNVNLTISPGTPWLEGTAYEVFIDGVPDDCGQNRTFATLPILKPFQQGPYYGGTDDTELRQGGNQGAVVQGANPTVTVDNSDGTPAGISHALLRFRDIIGSGPARIPPGSIIKSALLTLYSTVNNAQTTNTISFHRMLMDWDEASATYNSMIDGVANDDVEAVSVALGSLVPNFPDPLGVTVQFRSVNLTADVQSWADGRPNHGWVLRSSGADGYRFESSENGGTGNRPALLIDFDPPQPNTPPQIVSHPSTVIVCTNEPAFFSVTASGTRPIYYQWRKNGANIRGATESTLIFPSVQVQDGGSYSVVVVNEFGVATSGNALLCLCTNSVPLVPAGDNFANRTLLPPVLSGALQSENTFATKEPGEPNHAGEAGGKSVWYTWRAPARGIATISTRGSTFDTVLAVYRGVNVNNLVAVAQNDDKRPIAGTLATGWFFTSELKFNATNGVDYHIAIDGFSCYDGKLVLSGQLEQTSDFLPVITNQPLSATVERGVTNTFSVSASGATTYQWFRQAVLIAGATNSTLRLTNVQPDDVGDYTVQVQSPQGRSVESAVATLEIGSFPSALSRDKVVLQLCASNRQQQFEGLRPQPFELLADGIPALLVGAGGFQIMNNVNSTVQQLEPPHCTAVGNASRWLTVTNRDEGILVVHTGGSRIPTVLAAYTNRSGVYFPDVSADLDCAKGNLLDGSDTFIKFHARRDGLQDGKYWLVVDGSPNFGALNPFKEGIIQLNYVLCPIGRVFPTNTSMSVTQGNYVVFCAGVTPLQAEQRTFQWRRNGVPIIGANRDVFILSNIGPGHEGAYSVVNNGVVVTGPTLRVFPLLQFAKPEPTRIGQQVQVTVRGTSSVPAGVAFRIEASTNLARTNWTGQFTNRGPQVFNFTDLNSQSKTQRYYRAVVP